MVSPEPIVNALAPIAAHLVRVWHCDIATRKWSLYDPAAPAWLNTLDSFENGKIYAICVKARTTIPMKPKNGDTIWWELSPGWNDVIWLG